MAVKIRLKRMGAKKSPFYRIVAADSRMPRDGRFIEQLGTYDPRQTPAIVTIKEEEVLKWLNNGAQLSDTVKNLLSEKGIIAAFAKAKDAESAAKPKKEKTLKATKKPAAKKPAAKKPAEKKPAAKKAPAKKVAEKKVEEVVEETAGE